MTGFIILGAVVLLLALLLFSRARLEIAVRGDNILLTLRYLFLRFNLSPEAMAARSERTAKKEAKKKFQSEKKKKAKEPKETKTAVDTVQMIWALLKSSRRALNIIRRHLVFSRVAIYVSVGSEDAHETAERHGQVVMAVIAALDLVGCLFVLKKPKTVAILPDFTRAVTKYECSVRIAIRPAFVLAAGVTLLKSLLPLLMGGQKKWRKQKPPPQKTPAKSA